MSVDPEWLEGQAQKLFDNFAGWEQRTLQYIGARIKKTGKMSMADVRVLNNIAVVNQDTDIIFRDLAKVTGYSISELEKIYGAVIESEHNKTKVLHDYRNEPFVPFEENTKLQSMVKAFSKASAEEMINITKTKALGFVDEIGAFHNVKDTLYKALGAATVAVTTGTEDFNTALRRTIETIGGSGLRVNYGGGVTRRLDSVVRQNILWGVKQTSMKYHQMIGEELGCDGIEIDWHMFPRPSHEFMGGKQYSLEGKKIVNGVTFESATEALEALEDYGCLHDRMPIICGVSEPTYSPEQLAELNRKSSTPIEIDGKTKTGYEWKQTMRQLERNARSTREQLTLAKATGDSPLATKCRQRLKAINTKYNEIADKTGIKAQPEKMRVYGKTVGKLDGKNSVAKSVKSGIINTEGDNMGVSIEIDEFTPCLVEKSSGRIIDTQYSLATKEDLKLKGWKFNWNSKNLDNSEVYKLTLKNENDIQGLVALKKFHKDNAIYVQLVESAPHNIGKNKKYDGVGGHLFAISIQKSLEYGYGGFVFMDAKNIDLVKHYSESLGAVHIGGAHPYRMFIDENNAMKVLNLYTLEEK